MNLNLSSEKSLVIESALNDEKKVVDDKEVTKIKDEYEKIVAKFFDSLADSIEEHLKGIKNRKIEMIYNSNTCFNAYLKNKSIPNLYRVYNSIFGPNEINSKDWTNTFSVDSQKIQLDKLSKEFHELTE
jgi:hypothetical protein